MHSFVRGFLNNSHEIGTYIPYTRPYPVFMLEFSSFVLTYFAYFQNMKLV